jgi:hypothetical protein
MTMSRPIAIAIAIFCCSVISVASAQKPFSAETLLVSPPAHYKLGFHSAKNNSLINEYVPAAESVDDWTNMATVQIFRGAAVDPPTFLQTLAKGYIEHCPGTTAKGIFTGNVNGYVVSMLLLTCPTNPKTGKPETTAFRVIKGADALYSVQRAWRAVPSSKDLDDAMHSLGAVTVCDTRTPDHPCPSLDSIPPLK